MLTITIPGVDYFNELTNEFVEMDPTTVTLEHSLVSLSKWESEWCKPFLTDTEHTNEETIDYVRKMTLTPDVDPSVYSRLSDENIREVNEYLTAKMTATWFYEPPSSPARPGKKEVVTAEIIYYWMISLNIPFECQTWHLNRLLTLIRVCNQKNSPPKKMSRQEVIARQKALNQQRKQQLNTRG